jgi:predicted dehydrogenase
VLKYKGERMYKVGIIGAGSIGALKPDNIDSIERGIPLTHAHAVVKDIQLELSWIYDVDKQTMVAAATKWECKYEPDYHMRNNAVDILVIAVPTEHHLETIIEITGDDDSPKMFDYRPRIIVLEKPAGANIHESNKIRYLSMQTGIPIVVNYGRRFCPEIISVYNRVVKYELVQSAVFYYTRGLIRDGSHAIDVLNQFFGDYIRGELFGQGLNDYSENDLTYGARLSYSRCDNVFLIPCDGRLFDVFELHIMTERGRLVYSNHFKSIYSVKSVTEDTYGNYKSLPSINTLDAISPYTHLEQSLSVLYSEVRLYLDKKMDTLSCTMSDALRVHNVLDKLLLTKEK